MNTNKPVARPVSFADVLNNAARIAGKTTIMQHMPGQGFCIWVTEQEADPMQALLSAALDILVKRGKNVDASRGISVRRMLVAAPGAEVFWQVTDNEGAIIASGYAASETEAATKVAEHVKMPTAAEAAQIERGSAPTPYETRRREHVLFTDNDADRPDVICDRNGQVTLGLCKVCNRGEAQLEEDGGECPGAAN